MRRRLVRALMWAPVVVAYWPFIRCGWCGRRVFAWGMRSHVFGHVADHARALRESYDFAFGRRR